MSLRTPSSSTKRVRGNNQPLLDTSVQVYPSCGSDFEEVCFTLQIRAEWVDQCRDYPFFNDVCFSVIFPGSVDAVTTTPIAQWAFTMDEDSSYVSADESNPTAQHPSLYDPYRKGVYSVVLSVLMDITRIYALEDIDLIITPHVRSAIFDPNYIATNWHELTGTSSIQTNQANTEKKKTKKNRHSNVSNITSGNPTTSIPSNASNTSRKGRRNSVLSGSNALTINPLLSSAVQTLPFVPLQPIEIPMSSFLATTYNNPTNCKGFSELLKTEAQKDSKQVLQSLLQAGGVRYQAVQSLGEETRKGNKKTQILDTADTVNLLQLASSAMEKQEKTYTSTQPEPISVVFSNTDIPMPPVLPFTRLEFHISVDKPVLSKELQAVLLPYSIRVEELEGLVNVPEKVECKYDNLRSVDLPSCIGNVIKTTPVETDSSLPSVSEMEQNLVSPSLYHTVPHTNAALLAMLLLHIDESNVNNHTILHTTGCTVTHPLLPPSIDSNFWEQLPGFEIPGGKVVPSSVLQKLQQVQPLLPFNKPMCVQVLVDFFSNALFAHTQNTRNGSAISAAKSVLYRSPLLYIRPGTTTLQVKLHKVQLLGRLGLRAMYALAREADHAQVQITVGSPSFICQVAQQRASALGDVTLTNPAGQTPTVPELEAREFVQPLPMKKTKKKDQDHMDGTSTPTHRKEAKQQEMKQVEVKKVDLPALHLYPQHGLHAALAFTQHYLPSFSRCDCDGGCPTSMYPLYNAFHSAYTNLGDLEFKTTAKDTMDTSYTLLTSVHVPCSDTLVRGSVQQTNMQYCQTQKAHSLVAQVNGYNPNSIVFQCNTGSNNNNNTSNSDISNSNNPSHSNKKKTSSSNITKNTNTHSPLQHITKNYLSLPTIARILEPKNIPTMKDVKRHNLTSASLSSSLVTLKEDSNLNTSLFQLSLYKPGTSIFGGVVPKAPSRPAPKSLLQPLLSKLRVSFTPAQPLPQFPMTPTTLTANSDPSMHETTFSRELTSLYINPICNVKYSLCCCKQCSTSSRPALSHSDPVAALFPMSDLAIANAAHTLIDTLEDSLINKYQQRRTKSQEIPCIKYACHIAEEQSRGILHSVQVEGMTLHPLLIVLLHIFKISMPLSRMGMRALNIMQKAPIAPPMYKEQTRSTTMAAPRKSLHGKSEVSAINAVNPSSAMHVKLPSYNTNLVLHTSNTPVNPGILRFCIRISKDNLHLHTAILSKIHSHNSFVAHAAEQSSSVAKMDFDLISGITIRDPSGVLLILETQQPPNNISAVLGLTTPPLLWSVLGPVGTLKVKTTSCLCPLFNFIPRLHTSIHQGKLLTIGKNTISPPAPNMIPPIAMMITLLSSLLQLTKPEVYNSLYKTQTPQDKLVQISNTCNKCGFTCLSSTVCVPSISAAKEVCVWCLVSSYSMILANLIWSGQIQNNPTFGMNNTTPGTFDTLNSNKNGLTGNNNGESKKQKHTGQSINLNSKEHMVFNWFSAPLYVHESTSKNILSIAGMFLRKLLIQTQSVTSPISASPVSNASSNKTSKTLSKNNALLSSSIISIDLIHALFASLVTPDQYDLQGALGTSKPTTSSNANATTNPISNEFNATTPTSGSDISSEEECSIQTILKFNQNTDTNTVLQNNLSTFVQSLYPLSYENLQDLYHSLEAVIPISTVSMAVEDRDTFIKTLFQELLQSQPQFIQEKQSQYLLNSLDIPQLMLLISSIHTIHGKENSSAQEDDLKLSEHIIYDSSLLRACSQGRIDVVKYLLKSGGDVNQADMYGVTPLLVACKHGHIELAKCLIENGADVNCVSKDGLSPLYTAAELGFLDIVKYLIQHNCQVNILNEDGISAFHIATQNNHLYVAKYLLDHGAENHTQPAGSRNSNLLKQANNLHYNETSNANNTNSNTIDLQDGAKLALLNTQSYCLGDNITSLMSQTQKQEQRKNVLDVMYALVTKLIQTSLPILCEVLNSYITYGPNNLTVPNSAGGLGNNINSASLNNLGNTGSLSNNTNSNTANSPPGSKVLRRKTSGRSRSNNNAANVLQNTIQQQLTNNLQNAIDTAAYEYIDSHDITSFAAHKRAKAQTSATQPKNTYLQTGLGVHLMYEMITEVNEYAKNQVETKYYASQEELLFTNTQKTLSKHAKKYGFKNNYDDTVYPDKTLIAHKKNPGNNNGNGNNASIYGASAVYATASLQDEQYKRACNSITQKQKDIAFGTPITHTLTIHPNVSTPKLEQQHHAYAKLPCTIGFASKYIYAQRTSPIIRKEEEDSDEDDDDNSANFHSLFGTASGSRPNRSRMGRTMSTKGHVNARINSIDMTPVEQAVGKYQSLHELGLSLGSTTERTTMGMSTVELATPIGVMAERLHERKCAVAHADKGNEDNYTALSKSAVDLVLPTPLVSALESVGTLDKQISQLADDIIVNDIPTEHQAIFVECGCESKYVVPVHMEIPSASILTELVAFMK